MRIRRSTVLVVLAVAIALISAGFSSKVQSQQQAGNSGKSAPRKVEVGRAIYELFATVSASCKVSPHVQGTVVIGSKNTTFETQLQEILRQVKATYVIYGGVYYVVPESERADAASWFGLQNKGEQTGMAQITFGESPLGQVGETNIPSLEFEQADVRGCLRSLFQKVHVSYTISPEVQGIVTISLKNVTFENALKNLLRQVDATYRVEGGVFQIVKRTADIAPNVESLGESRVIAPQGQMLTANTMVEDTVYLYVLQGSMLYKVRKADLKTVSTAILGGN